MFSPFHTFPGGMEATYGHFYRKLLNQFEFLRIVIKLLEMYKNV